METKIDRLPFKKDKNLQKNLEWNSYKPVQKTMLTLIQFSKKSESSSRPNSMKNNDQARIKETSKSIMMTRKKLPKIVNADLFFTSNFNFKSFLLDFFNLLR